MSTRQQQPTAPTNVSRQCSDGDRENSVLQERTVVYDRAAQERALQEKAARESFNQGYLEGRERAAKDYANLSAQLRSQPERNGVGTTLGISLGILMTVLIGGSIAASFYFDGRIDALSDETESLNETLEEQERDLDDGDLDDGEVNDGDPFSNLFQREEAPDTQGVEATSPEQPAESFPPQRESETTPIEPGLPDVGDIDSDISGVNSEASSEIAE